MFQVLYSYKKTINNHYRLKCLIDSTYKINNFIKVIITTNFKNIVSFKIKDTIEALFYLRLISNQKSYIFYYKKKYKECDLMLKLTLSKKNIDYLTFLWIIFYFPILNKREIILKLGYTYNKDIMFSCNLYNIYPYNSDVYFTSLNKIVYSIILKNKIVNQNLLFLSYYNFPMK